MVLTKFFYTPNKVWLSRAKQQHNLVYVSSKSEEQIIFPRYTLIFQAAALLAAFTYPSHIVLSMLLGMRSLAAALRLEIY
ncbi:hypothetical protein [Photorhabdus asymbiotica]|uniref:hypothetical protein n=1 Tax=Photorhabdus asymbiotica TaxID=291112 RepID=UPI003DA6D5DB